MNQIANRDNDMSFLRPRSMEEAMKFCELMADSDFVPEGYRGKPGNVLAAVQMGSEIGLSPMRALRCIAVIKGRPTMWGDEMLAMVLASPVCEYVDESESTDVVGVCKTKRRGATEKVTRFTLDHARQAGLLSKPGPWQTARGRMLKLRARGYALRDDFADVLAGLCTAEEAMDTMYQVDMPSEGVNAGDDKDVGSTGLRDRMRRRASEITRTVEVSIEPEQEQEQEQEQKDAGNGPAPLVSDVIEPENIEPNNAAPTGNHDAMAEEAKALIKQFCLDAKGASALRKIRADLKISQQHIIPADQATLSMFIMLLKKDLPSLKDNGGK